MRTLNEWLNDGRKVVNQYYARIQRVKCADGFSVSIQASSGHYCHPRKTLGEVDYYSQFELGYPSSLETDLLEYAEDPDNPTDTVYGWVPRETIEKVIASHGGIVAFETQQVA